MPVPAIPVLTAIARFVLAKGTREAVKKYGKAAVTKAKDLIKKRDKAIERTKRERKFNVAPQQRWKERGLDEEYHRVRSPAEQREFDIQQSARRAGSELRRQSGSVRPPREGVPLKLKKGGKVRGAGRAIRGVRPCKMY